MITGQQLEEWGKDAPPNSAAGKFYRSRHPTHENPSRPQIQSTKSERHEAAALDVTNEGETACVQRTVVRFVGYRCRPLDPDNFAGGCKDALDGLRHAGLIPGDEPWRIDFQTSQIRVSSRAEERTEITLEIP